MLPLSILSKAIKRCNEYGWKQENFAEVINACKEKNIAIIGGQIQYVLPNATFELYWLNYDTTSRQNGETWEKYCRRSIDECYDKFLSLTSQTDIKNEAIEYFPELKAKNNEGVDIDDYKIFIIYFDI